MWTTLEPMAEILLATGFFALLYILFVAIVCDIIVRRQRRVDAARHRR